MNRGQRDIPGRDWYIPEPSWATFRRSHSFPVAYRNSGRCDWCDSHLFTQCAYLYTLIFIYIYICIAQACVRALSSNVTFTTRHSRHAIVLKNVKPKREVWCGSWVCGMCLTGLEWSSGCALSLVMFVSSWFQLRQATTGQCTYCNMVFVILLLRCWYMHLLATHGVGLVSLTKCTSLPDYHK